ncbi:hypothetical protein Tco_0969791 [Tanacetum coccineum]
MTTLAEFMIIAGADNRPPMLEKYIYDSWKTRMILYIENRENGIMILNSLLNGLLVWPTIDKENGDDPIACLNKAMAFLSAVATSRFTLINNQLRTSSNPRNHTTIQDDKGNATSSGGNNAGGQARVVKCYNFQGEGNMDRKCTQPKRPRNVAWFKEKAMLAEAHESGQILDEEQLAFIADPGILDGQASQTTIPNTASFQTEDLDAYDSNCDDVSNAKVVLMANLSNFGSDVISEVPNSESYHNDLDNQSVHAMQDFEQTIVVEFTDNEITIDSNIISYSQYLLKTQ